MQTKLAGPPAPEEPPVNGRWRLGARRGGGADAVTWEATDARDGRRVALKVLAAVDGEARERLRWEFALLSTIEHPHLVRVLDLDVARGPGPLAEGLAFFTCELLDGTQPTRLSSLPVDERARRLCQLLADVASALEALHRRGLVHHDVKPANLLSDEQGRARLGDLGLSRARGGAGGLRGSTAYLPPEAFLDGAGDDARVDLYALGVSAHELWTGRPLRAGTLAEVVRAASQPAPPLDDAPAGLRELVARLIDPDPARRPSSARRVVEEALRLGARLDGALVDPAAPRTLSRPALVGRAQALADARAALAEAHVLVIEGPPGSGRSRLVEALKHAQQLAAAERGEPPPAWHGPSLAAALRTLDAPVQGPLGRLCARLDETAAVLHLDLSASADLDPIVRDLLELAGAGALGRGRLVVEAQAGLAPSAHARRVSLAPLDEGAMNALVGSMIDDAPAAFVRAVQRASTGLPRLAVALVQAACARAKPGAPPTAADVDAVLEVGRGDLHALVVAAVRRLPEAVRAVVEALAVSGRAATVGELAALAERDPIDTLAAVRAAAGLVELDENVARFPSRAHAQAALAATPPSRRLVLHRRALARAVGDDDRAVADRARHRAVLGPPDQAAAAAGEAATRALARGELAVADEQWTAALRLRPDDTAPRLRLAEVRTLRARYAEALEILAPVESAAAHLAAARVLQRAGAPAAAEARLRALLADGDALPVTERAEARGLYARLLLQRGAVAEAIAATEGEAGLSASLDEARGLARYYAGRFDEAEAAFAALERGARARGPIALARARSLSGMVLQAREELSAAAAAYAEALALARTAGDLHGAAIYAGNLGVVLREQAEYERAMAPTAEAARDLGCLGKRVEQAGALFNWGNLLLSVGDLDGAAAAAAEARALAEAAAAPRELGYARLLEADLARRTGDAAAAVEACRAALEAFAGGAAVDRVIARRNLAEALAEAQRRDEAARALAAAIEAAQAASADDLLSLAAARVPLELAQAPAAAAVERLARAHAHAARTGRRDLRFRAALTLGRIALRDGDSARALGFIDDARVTFEEILMRTPELRRPQAAEDPDARKLRDLLAIARSAAPSAPAPSAPPARDSARRLLAINKRLNSELRLDRLLELILDTVIELTSAERGFLLLAGTDGVLAVSIARNIDQQALASAAEDAAFSRSIAERAAREGVPIVTLDAAGDERFEAARSVSHLKLRSVLAVPLAVKGRVVGCVYADHRLRAGAFGEDDVALVCDLAEQAAIAIENARLLEDNEAKRREVAQLARELEQKVAEQAIELTGLHEEVRQGRAALAVRYNYDQLVGRTPRMVELFRLLDRVTDTALPVVIYGESGTGKELVARALHHNGPRKARPFVSESCAAIPETLLEAALFGHTRGAFTGADSERRGLFEVAHGGTLFLDEVGEMSAAMQGKLLRVLQTGEFRRVGGERTVKVDVRVLVASNRDLGRLVEEGRFREDLYYRLNVVRVALPPLRERRDDIPLLVEHFLREQAGEAGGKPRRIARAALQKLVAWRWPGNVRELENEVRRAASLGGEVITVEDLSPQVASGEAEAAFDAPDDLGLKKRVERLERTLLREAMARAGGNQSEAARLLGLSRFGLQKKLRRYRLAP